jgi:ankyrin repeat protein
MAIENKQHEAAKLLVELGADVNASDSYYNVPLSVAVKNKMFDTVQFLLKNGVDKSRNDALISAISNKDEKIALLLIDSGIALGANEDPGETPLFYAIRQPMLPVVKALVLAGADVNYIGLYKTTPLMDAAYQGDMEITRFLIESGADKRIQNSDGDTAFTIAQKQKHDELLELLRPHP